MSPGDGSSPGLSLGVVKIISKSLGIGYGSYIREKSLDTQNDRKTKNENGECHESN